MDIQDIAIFCMKVSFFISLLLLLFFIHRFWILYKSFAGLPSYNFFAFIIQSCWIRLFKKLQDFPPLTSTFFQTLNGICHIYSEKGIAVCWLFHRSVVLVFNPEIIKNLINHPAVLDKPPEYDVLKHLFGLGLLTSKGELWQSHRKLITPTFHLKNLREYNSIFNKNAIILVNKLKGLSEEPWINISEHLTYCTFDVIWESTTGVCMGTQEGNEDAKQYMEGLTILQKVTIQKLFHPWMQIHSIFRFTSMGSEMQKALNTSHSITKKIINEKKKVFDFQGLASEEINGDVTKRKKRSFLDSLIENHKHNPKFTLKNVQDEVNTIISAGYDTVAITLKWSIYLLGLHPDIQETAFQELNVIFENKLEKITYDDLHSMQYLDCVIKEALRLYPSVPVIARTVKEDLQVCGHKLPKGCAIAFNIYLLHRNSEIFPDPEKFDPDRFLPENSINRHPYAFMPFSAGVRNCIGQKFAMMEVKVLLAHILRNFKIQALDHRDKIRVTWEVVLKNADELRVRLARR